MSSTEEARSLADWTSWALAALEASLRSVPKLARELFLKLSAQLEGKERLVGASLLLIGANLYYYRKFTYWSRRNVKNPPPLPLVGNFLSLVVFEYQSLSLGWMRKYGKVYGIYSGSAPQLVVADANVVRQICIKDFDKFTDHQFLKVPNKYQESFLIIQKGDQWRSMRAIISPTFTSGKMKMMYRILSQCADDMVKLIHGQLSSKSSSTVIDSRAAAGALTMGSALGSFYGIKLNDEGPENVMSKQYYSKRSHEAFTPSLWRFFALALVPSAVAKFFKIPEFEARKMEFFFEKAKAIVNHRLKSSNKERPNDYLQLLIEARADSHLEDFDVERHSDHYTLNNGEPQLAGSGSSQTGEKPSRMKLSEWQIACQVVMLMLVATETTAALISHTLFLLANHEEIQQKLFEQLANIARREDKRVHFDYDEVVSHQYLDCVVSEVLRLMSPALRVDRKANQDYLIEDYGIRVSKGMIVQIDLNALHKNPEYWSEPDKFVPERFAAENKHKIVPGSYCPFGVGPRACVGFRFALTEAKVAIAKLVSEFKFGTAPGTVYPAIPKKPLFVGTNFKDLRVAVRARC